MHVLNVLVVLVFLKRHVKGGLGNLAKIPGSAGSVQCTPDKSTSIQYPLGKEVYNAYGRAQGHDFSFSRLVVDLHSMSIRLEH